MKKLLIYLTYILLLGFGLFACNKDENIVTFQGGDPPVLTASSTEKLQLTKDKGSYRALQFQWTNPNYTFSNGVNTQDVYYFLQIDVENANFNSLNKYETSLKNTLDKSFTVKELNAALALFELENGEYNNYEIRILANLENRSVSQYSNVVKISISTYLDVVYEVPEQLFIIGAALPSGWTNTAVALIGQKMTKVNNYLFQLDRITFTKDEFHFTSRIKNLDNDWVVEYGFTGEAGANNELGDSFNISNVNFMAPDPGDYKVLVNFRTAKYSLEKL